MTGLSVKPEKEYKVGAVRAAIWCNPRTTSDGRQFNSHKVILERTYKDASGNFKSTSSLDVNDIPKAILALKKAYEFCMAPKKPETSAAPPRETDYATIAAKNVP